ncbi:Smr/MutS family protein [Sphingomicrobium lutaoense]|uniref:DNA-nicking Smr family endonuclease n=1 Tax=Sphingomicrobium lutaoense TaxID=515949 RepID=A0A839Z2Q4_9SPHN|nr:Smr/MutS family protein [Sphingomicrobium lutaoense]MBB3763912.1 DNA-nicking Smr family endonuclease [Sphingomicrobium lutaoense]
MRKLGDDEAELWARVVATVEPLSRDPATRDTPPPASPPPRAAPLRRRPVASPPPAPPPRKAPLDASTLDGGWDRRLRGGKVAPDRVLDLHGHSLDRAWEAIDRGLDDAIRQGERLVLLITGHAPRGEPPVKRGRIRAAVNDWLAASRHADHIAAVRGAAPAHGGRGAIYVVLRRRR